MQSALRPYVTTGVALVGASLIAAGSVLPVEAAVSAAQERTISSMDVGLTAASTALAPGQSYANILPNLINAVLSVPQAEIDGINRFSAAMEESRSWWVYSKYNVLGWDPPNEEMTKGFVDMLLPFKPYSTQAGIQTFYWFAANFPMDAGCSGFPPCPDPGSILSHMFTVAPWEFYLGNGYTFPAVINPISDEETYWGQELGQTGDPTNWSGTTVKLDPNAGWEATWNYLLDTPEPVDFPTGKEIWDTTVRLTSALWKSWYPFVPQSTLWNPQMSISAYLWRPFARVLCADCNKADPFMPVDWKPGDDIPPNSYVPLKYKKDYDENGHWIGPTPTEDETSTSVGTALLAAKTTPEVTAAVEDPAKDTSDTVKPAKKNDFLATAIQNLTDKFNQGKTDAADGTDAGKGEVGQTPAPEVTPVADKTDTASSGDDAKPTKKWTFGKNRKDDTDTSSADTSKADTPKADAAGSKSSDDAKPAKKAPKFGKRDSGGDGAGAKAGAAKSDGGDSK
ncbi:hypothetical protein FK535_13365 [Mycolicibacterium sp. 018/SC-01/001]|uniref:hypothetical protein n=1 Tax=Mycolicibacterium sp. 018/SC-01/001 TaxID=2592069 RepID=UPI0011804FE3|nr:hypothetical protein [Mycolicibacterium sp. 018/SC-01/001]TRW82376.1 hypothetical protein FK535_13365 [Mycolicibacterium sp. 018/SC-01/001]